MDKKIAGLLGALTGLATVGFAQAAVQAAASPSDVLRASSYADLLAPIANAAAVLKADDAARAQLAAAGPETVKIAQGYYYPYYRNPYYPPVYNQYYDPYYQPYYYRHHHHRHHHHHHHHHFRD